MRVAPDFDRSLLAGIPHAWLSSNELLFSALDRGSMTVMRARIGRRNAYPSSTATRRSTDSRSSKTGGGDCSRSPRGGSTAQVTYS